ncbi:MAG: hypothetical protein Q8Q58_14380, partial [Candidatus Rokubacteria bacterium]|nr:hypothetical protein [Candidatus Rokubacteria bacterium]
MEWGLRGRPASTRATGSRWPWRSSPAFCRARAPPARAAASSLAIVVTTLLAGVVTFPALRVRGEYLILLTLAFQ